MLTAVPVSVLRADNPDKEKYPPTVYMVSNAHFDTQWRWDVRQSIGEFIPNTLHQNFYLFEHYPDYVFNFEGAVKYSWMKEYYPEQYKRVKKYVEVADGVFRICVYECPMAGFWSEGSGCGH